MSDKTDYHKIQTFFLRDPATKHKTVLFGQYALPEFEYLAWGDWIWTEKVDGTNVRVTVNPQDTQPVQFGGHHENSQMPTKLLTHLQEVFTFDSLRETLDFSKLAQEDATAVLYGEGFGAGIQKGGGNYGSKQRFILFDVCIGGIWLERQAVEDIAQKLGVQVVPVIGVGNMWEAVNHVKNGMQSEVFQTSYVEPHAAEGLVCRPRLEMRNRLGHRIITKLKVKDFQGVKNG
jgi:hypothetical protein